ncbi:hypothetical protein [Streptomyces sp. NPDC054863]
MTTTKTAKKPAPAIRNLANPQRTTLAHLDSSATPAAAALPEYAQELPTVTANSRRTILMVAPEPQQQPVAVSA